MAQAQNKPKLFISSRFETVYERKSFLCIGWSVIRKTTKLGDDLIVEVPYDLDKVIINGKEYIPVSTNEKGV